MLPRAAGVLLHPTSLPGPYGVGDLGPAAVVFLDWAASAGFRLWQVLPLGPTGYGNSPYGSPSAFAGNPLLISPDRLRESGLLPRPALTSRPVFIEGRVDFARAAAWKETLLRAAHEHFRAHAPRRLRAAYEAWSAAPEQSGWLDDWALYSALKRAHDNVSWTDWPVPLRDRAAEAVAKASRSLRGEIAFHRFVQFVFARQWQELREAAGQHGIAILGDVPIYVAHDSADVWSHRDLFQLDPSGQPTVVAGVPPDYFSPTGQRWGNPLYDWSRHAATGYAWWSDRLRANLARNDWVRLDHFRGFAAYWEVAAAEATAVKGRWVEGPGEALFAALRRSLGEDLPLVAEDLGIITEEVEALRERLGLPGMKVLQFAFAEDDSPHAPHRHVARAVVYSGTHDNDTAAGWYAALGAAEKRGVDDYLGRGEPIAVRLVRSALTSVADWAVVPAQDLFGLGSEARMNTPGEPAADWAWRARREQFTEELAAALRRTARTTGRLREPAAQSPGV